MQFHCTCAAPPPLRKTATERPAKQYERQQQQQQQQQRGPNCSYLIMLKPTRRPTRPARPLLALPLAAAAAAAEVASRPNKSDRVLDRFGPAHFRYRASFDKGRALDCTRLAGPSLGARQLGGATRVNLIM